jgi:hypothetical protein
MGISATFRAFDAFLTKTGVHFPMTVLESAGLTWLRPVVTATHSFYPAATTTLSNRGKA